MLYTSECCPQKVRKQSKLEIIEILIVSQLPTMYSESSNIVKPEKIPISGKG